jgi:hypothetical protein
VLNATRTNRCRVHGDVLGDSRSDRGADLCSPRTGLSPLASLWVEEVSAPTQLETTQQWLRREGAPRELV